MTAVRPRRTGHHGYTLTKTRVPETAVEARYLARVALSAWGLDDMAETAALLLSELVANAVRHAHGPTVRIVVDHPADDRVYVAVVDRSPRQLPEMRTPDPDDVNGRGSLLVDELADRWGYDLMGPGQRPWGKCVWAEMQVSR
ncbi:ATP-binding protein [Streptomyces sp. H27-D2]|uniref:ATP-binding protein n=1 Tax=Streptomyces sp. H27-D2 TaxID=3046304 RepID=UPI002DB8D0D3|nr:ATP-binding protein [Streptomyces sp. H27-D2]MEC4020452.1 ATP-binding protein [Streptomyces sp. H27-D2]